MITAKCERVVDDKNFNCLQNEQDDNFCTCMRDSEITCWWLSGFNFPSSFRSFRRSSIFYKWKSVQKFLSHEKHGYRHIHVLPCIFSCENLPTSQHSSDSSLENAFCCWFLHLMVATQLFLSVSNALLLDQSRIAVWFSIYTAFYDERSFSSVFVSLDSRDPRSKPMPLDCIP